MGQLNHKIRYNIMYDYDLNYIKSKLNPKYMSIYCMVDKFMETNPPCKECLVRAICVINLIHKDLPYPYLYIKSCDKLKEFVTNNEIFTDNEIATEFERTK